jgi:DNA-binding response OmpR family regulator/DNA-binding CsgD family transcriptional regulator
MHDTPTVLVVDDVPENLGLLLETFSLSGFRVLVAESGESALAQLLHTAPDIILLDYRLPGIDGLAVCNAIRAKPEFLDIPILFLTALEDIDAKVRVFEAGAVDYVTKPIQPREVLARVRTHLRIALLQRELAEEVAMRREAEAQLCDSLDRALVVVATDGRIQFATRLAQTFLAKYFPNPSRKQLPESILATTLGLRQQEAACTDNTAPSKRPITAPTLPQGLEVRLLASSNPSDSFVLEFLVSEPSKPGRLIHLGLTPREAEVLFWLSEGKTNGEIGLILDSSRRTIEKHVEHILEKLRVENRGAAARLALSTMGSLSHASSTPA